MIKAYTDIEQSRKLMEFLPIESADMRFCFSHTLDGRITGHYPMIGSEPSLGTIPCWSLAALYAILPDELKDDGDIYRLQLFHLKAKYIVSYPRLTTLWPIFAQEEGDSSVDACYKMIVKLHDQKLI